MGKNDQNNCKREQNQLIIVQKLVGEQEMHSGVKKAKRHETMMMIYKTRARGQSKLFATVPVK